MSTFGGLVGLAAWLAETEVTLVGMEATGVYWKTVFPALEDGFECWLLNAHHLRDVPGRKTDVKDSEWIRQLVQHGLVRPSFVPSPPARCSKRSSQASPIQSSSLSCRWPGTEHSAGATSPTVSPPRSGPRSTRCAA